MRRAPRGARCMECADRDTRGAAALECISGRIIEQFLRESCSYAFSDTFSVVAAPRVSQSANSVRRPPYKRFS
eukprot:7936446-Lingulodinium_polyedra.AAC.1